MKTTLITTTLALALTVPTLAGAAPIVWHHVPESRVDDVPDHEMHTMDADGHAEDVAFAVERREQYVEEGRERLRELRRARRIDRQVARELRRDVRQARRAGEDFTMELAMARSAERGALEADDAIDLQKARIDARRDHVRLERARRSLARARVETVEAGLLQEHGVDGARLHPMKRYERQEDRVARMVDRRGAAWALARVDVRERNQDFDRGTNVVAAWVMPERASEMGRLVRVSDAGSGGTTEVGELRRVHFDLGSAELDTDALNDLAWNSWVLRSHRDATVRIEGHTDATGPQAFNRELAWERAEVIETFLTRNGVWDSQLEIAGFGESDLRVQTRQPSPVNRRAEFRVIDDADGLVDGTLDDAALGDDLDR